MKVLTTLLLLLSTMAFSQEKNPFSKQLYGYWEGAIIKSNSYQQIAVTFSQRDGKTYSLQYMEEWYPAFGEFETPVTTDSLGRIIFSTGYGKAGLSLDENNLEMTGEMLGFNPSIYLHLKKTTPPPAQNYTVEKVAIQSGKVQLNGHFHIPRYLSKKTAIILVGGRGCWADDTEYNLYGKLLRRYGVSVLAYQKRGTGNSTGDCNTATIQDLANDLAAVHSYVAAHPNGYEKIGVLGISAGGWTMVKAQEKVDFDFMISNVGPSTSVKEQQMQSMAYGAAEYGVKGQALANVTRYTELIFSAPANQKGLNSMNQLLEKSESENWKDLLEDTDIPGDVNGISELWVRRHNFDPKDELQNFSKPFLAIYGDRDWIVPHEENTAKLKAYFANRPQLLTTVLAYNAEHGMEMESKWVKMEHNQTYWHFYRISPQVNLAIIEFLRQHQLIE